MCLDCSDGACTNLVRAADPPPADDDLNAVLWTQTSVESEANAIGAFALARIRLDQALADPAWTGAPAEQKGDFKSLSPAIVAEVDDTLLSTGAYQAWTVKDRARFHDKSWARYVQARRDTALPGAVDFATYAVSKGVKVFYVSNRTADMKAATIAELKTLGFPVPSDDTFLAFKEKADWMSAKGSRRAVIAQRYRILLLIGDQLDDFTDDYRGDIAQRQTVFNATRAHWGHDWIMLANPTYGSFEAAPYKGSTHMAPGDKRAQKIEALKAWDGK